MLTPHEIQERTKSLEKAVFGGYSTNAVDELLSALTENYTSLLQENASVKSRLKAVTERLEDYRSREENINRTMLTAQKTADDLISETERKCSRMINDTEGRLRQRSEALDREIEAETERVNRARQSAAEFIADLEDQIRVQLEQLENIKQMDLTVPRESEDGTAPQPVVSAPVSAEQIPEPAPVPGPAVQNAEEAPAQPASPAPAAAEQKAEEAPEPKPQEQPQSIETEFSPETLELTNQLENDIARVLAEANAPIETDEDLSDTRVIHPIG